MTGLAQLRTNVDANIAALEAGANEAASAKPAKGAEAQVCVHVFVCVYVYIQREREKEILCACVKERES